MLKFGRVYPLTPWGELTCWKLGHPSNMGEWKKPAFSCWDMILGGRVCISLLKKIPYCFFFCKYQSQNHDWVTFSYNFMKMQWQWSGNDMYQVVCRISEPSTVSTGCFCRILSMNSNAHCFTVCRNISGWSDVFAPFSDHDHGLMTWITWRKSLWIIHLEGITTRCI